MSHYRLNFQLSTALIIIFLFCIIISCSKSTDSKNRIPTTPVIDTEGGAPANSSENQPIEITLKWLCADPDNDTLIYDIYFGEQSPPTLLVDSVFEKSYELELLEYETAYYWKVVAFDGLGDSSISSVWSFTTNQRPNTWTTLYNSLPTNASISILEPRSNLFAVATGWGKLPTQSVLVSYLNAEGDILNFYNQVSISSRDFARSIISTSDGGIAVAGTSSYYDAFFIKINSDNPNPTTYVYPHNIYTNVWAVAQSNENKYCLAGDIGLEYSGPKDVMVLVVDEDGVENSRKTYGGSEHDAVYCMSPTGDGGFMLAGATNSFGAGDFDAYVLKIDSSGDTLWTKTFGGSGYEDITCMASIGNNEYVLAGEKDDDIYIMWIDNDGNLLSQKTIGWSGEEWAWDIDLVENEGFIIVGSTNSMGAGSYDIVLVRTDLSGNLLWKKTFGGASTEWGFSVINTSDGGFLIGSMTYSVNQEYPAAYIIKTDPYGQVFSSSRGQDQINSEKIKIDSIGNGSFDMFDMPKKRRNF